MPFTAGAPPGHGSRPGKRSLLADPWKKPRQYTYLDGERETRGHAPDALTWRTPEGIDVKPLYTAADLEGLEHLDSMPGFPPFVRGPRASMYAGRPWRCASTRVTRRPRNPTPSTARTSPRVRPLAPLRCIPHE